MLRPIGGRARLGSHGEMKDSLVVPGQLRHVDPVRAQHHGEVLCGEGLAIPLGCHVDVVINHGSVQDIRQRPRGLFLEKVVVYT